MIRIQQVKIPIEEVLKLSESQKEIILQKKIEKLCRIPHKDILSLSIRKQSLDARKKPELFFSFVVDMEIEEEEKFLKKCKNPQVSKVTEVPYRFPYNANTAEAETEASRPVIVGMGPAGLFCGYLLAKHGFRPILLERGKPVEERQKDVEAFWETGALHPESNVQFGEGGAGTFSDGKLNTLVKDKYGRNREVLKIFVEHGAPERILYENKPHIGTDILRNVIASMRQQMLSWGAGIRFETKVEELLTEGNRLTGVRLSTGEVLPVSKLVLAVGHSARDTFFMCHEKGIPMEAKPFAVGVRVEHPQSLIDKNQYGREEALLPAAAYKVTAQTKNGRGVYSFCMCPGGYVVNASSEPEMLAVNGMSYSGRDGANANSAIVVSVTPKDYPGNSPLAGIEFQRRLEEKAYHIGGGRIPVQYYKDFKGKEERAGDIQKNFQPSMKGQFRFAPVGEIFPEEIKQAIIEGMEQFERVIPGFGDDASLLSGVESRTSSPVRMIREKDGQSAIRGLYPCGEGAGYAGGITSAAMDGIFIAEMVAQQ